MKRWMLFLLAMLLSGCSRTPSTPEPVIDPEANILIAYFTMPEVADPAGVDTSSGASIVVRNGEVQGNLAFMANTIQSAVGGDLFQIETVDAYPINHETLVDQAATERSSAYSPELATQIENLDQYDIIFLGYP